MTGLKSSLSVGGPDSWLLPPRELIVGGKSLGLARITFSPLSPPKLSSASRFTTHARRLLRRCVLAILLAAGLIYATCSMLAEIDYVNGMTQGSLGDRVTALRQSAILFPFERRYRIASAILLGNLALAQNLEWKRVAAIELRAALTKDPTSADLLAMVVAFDLALDRTAEAQAYYDQFKRVAKKSPLLDMVRASNGGR